MSVVMFEDRVALCHAPCGNGPEFLIRAGDGAKWVDSRPHPGFRGVNGHNLVIELYTDDPAEAKAAFERGAEWVRTGLGP